ncbi:MAG: membrane-bound PQQ-dependent dehydrogenase, glucose/quinate/shikimate family, partial [Pseudomonadales bacterium]|nr:membrane-bound PQQ-dependent dehydrogenase, glucose/quinate/shikimate family [Pseudomonadales bacterium]
MSVLHRIGPLLTLGIGLGIGGCSESFDPTPASEALPRQTSAWPNYGGAGGRHFVDLDVLTKANVAELDIAWIHRTGDESTVFQGTPLLSAGQLVLCTPHNQVVALDPLTGGERWRFDPAVARHDRYANEGNCRGVASWRDGKAPEAPCGERILMATNDARLFALDARSGARCDEFGVNGEVDLALGVGRIAWDGEYQVTSPPTIAGDLAVVGSSVSDNGRTDAPSGVVRAFDVRSGTLRWAFDLAPPDFEHTTMPVSDAGWALGTPNVWAPMVADPERDLVFLPTGNPAPDYFRDGPADMDYYGSSVLALRASTGELVWQFRTVHDDFWDFDVPSQPVLADLDFGAGPVPALIQATKMGFVFVLHRET